MTLTRRGSLKILGTAGLIGAGTVGTFAATRSPSIALAPWQQAGEQTDPRLFALSYAILAPNPHNRQPWLVSMDTETTVTVFRDKTRDLPHTDPHSRQLTIGLGCFLELMRIAACAKAYDIDFELFPEGEDGPVAIATFIKGGKADPLFKHILDRRSCKEPFDQKPVATSEVETLGSLADIITDSSTVASLRELTLQAWATEAATARTLKESVDLMRFGKAEINRNPDGIDLGGVFLESLMVFGLLNREQLLDPDSTSAKQGSTMYEEMLHATPAYAVITSETNDRVAQIEAGRRWLRLNLTTTSLGLALHPVSQALQEFDEMASHYQHAHQLLAQPGHTVQMLGRLGYGPTVGHTPRWPLQTRIIDR